MEKNWFNEMSFFVDENKRKIQVRILQFMISNS